MTFEQWWKAEGEEYINGADSYFGWYVEEWAEKAWNAALKQSELKWPDGEEFDYTP